MRTTLGRLLATCLVAGWGHAESGFVEVPDGRIAWERAGSGQPLVLIHDGLLPGASWNEVWAALTARFDVVRWDRRGYGASTSDTRDYSNVDDLLAILDHLKLERVALVGCSSGGALALDFAIAHPERVGALVLEGPVLSGFPHSRHFYERGIRNRAPLRTLQDSQATLARWAKDPYITDSRNGAARARLRALLEQFPQSVTGGIPWSTRPEPDSRARLGEVKAGVRLIAGESDIADVHAHMGAIEGGVPGAERIVVPRAGHLVHLELPETFVSLVSEFLDPDGAALDFLARGAGVPASDQARALFDYDVLAPLDVQEAGVETRDGASVRDVSFASPLGGHAPAFVVEPSRPAADGELRAGLVFLHHGRGNRSTFLDEAVALAERGVVSVLVDAPENREPHAPPFDPEAEERNIRQTLTDLRRAFDLLAARPDLDPERMAFVGWSLGATMGGRLVGLEPRAKGFVLAAGWASYTLAARAGHGLFAAAYHGFLESAAQEAWSSRIEPLDGTHFMDGHAPMLLQFALRDEYISRIDAALYRAAAFPGARSLAYDVGHFELGHGPARRDREEWLAQLLSLPIAGAPPVRVRPITAHRGLPHTFHDQAVESLSALHPDLAFLDSVRLAWAGGVSYALVSWQRSGADEMLQAQAVAVRGARAWSFDVETTPAAYPVARAELLRRIEALSGPEVAERRVLTVLAGGQPLALSPERATELLWQIDVLIASCGVETLPALVMPDDDALSLEVRYPVPRVLQLGLPDRRSQAVQEIRIVADPSQNGGWPMQTLRHADESLGLAKCDGGVTLALLCQPELRPHAPASVTQTCALAP